MQTPCRGCAVKCNPRLSAAIYPPGRAGLLEPIRWEPHVSDRWDDAFGAVGQFTQGGIDPRRPVVIARCLDQIALVVERISEIARKIDARR
jgi:hypothetical protein